MQRWQGEEEEEEEAAEVGQMAVGEEKTGPFDWTKEEEKFYFNFCQKNENG